MSVKLLIECHLEFLSLKGGYTGSPESTHVKMLHCWKSHVIVCWQTILMKRHTLFFLKIGKDVAKFVVCCSCDLRFKG